MILESYGGGRLTLRLNAEQIDQMHGVLLGLAWFGVENNQPVFQSKLRPLPEVKPDLHIEPYFGAGKRWVPREFGTAEHAWSPHFDLAYLGAGCGENENPQAAYEREARKLESWGFFCMRSRRGPDGRYWEIWRLNGFWSAQNELETLCKRLDKDRLNCEQKISAVVDWLCQNVRFGTLDVSIQRAALTND